MRRSRRAGMPGSRTGPVRGRAAGRGRDGRRAASAVPLLVAATLQVALPFLRPAAVAAQEPPARGEAAHATAEGLVRHVYDLVTFPAGSTPDLGAVRAAFLPEAVIVLRTGRTESTIMTVDDFLDDWRRFIAEADVESTGFREEIVRLVPLVFGDIAHVLVLYEASIPGRLEPREGVDSFHLIRRDGRWWIAGILNEIPTAARPVPAPLREG